MQRLRPEARQNYSRDPRCQPRAAGIPPSHIVAFWLITAPESEVHNRVHNKCSTPLNPRSQPSLTCHKMNNIRIDLLPPEQKVGGSNPLGRTMESMVCDSCFSRH